MLIKTSQNREPPATNTKAWIWLIMICYPEIIDYCIMNRKWESKGKFTRICKPFY